MSTQVQGLFIDAKGPYPELLGRHNCWCNESSVAGVGDDARDYTPPMGSTCTPIVAHPPCQLWVNLAAVNWKRYGRQLPAWYRAPSPSDGGCFWSALNAIRQYGGVLEHPAFSHAWEHYGIPQPSSKFNWLQVTHFDGGMNLWTCEVWQSAYGHKARKRTWLLYSGYSRPFDLLWARQPGTHQIGWFDRNKPTLGKAEASRTPLAFAVELIRLARHSQKEAP